MVNLNNDWDIVLKDEFTKDYYLRLREFLKDEYRSKAIYPNMHDIFNSLRFTALKDIKAVIVGQDPYIRPGEAHGLAFSVQPQAKTPPSLLNIFKELTTDLNCKIPNNGHLVPWAKQGVLLLNTVLTVERGRSRSHAGRGWETFTDTVMQIINQRNEPTVFMLWGKDAQAKGFFLNNPRHLVLTAAHPSPLAGGKFFGCRHFSRANDFLIKHWTDPIDWQIPDIGENGSGQA